MKSVKVSVGNGYNVLIENGLLAQAGEQIKQVLSGKNAFVMSDSNVAELYLTKLRASLEDAGFNVFDFVFAAGEESKNITTVYNAVRKMAQCGLDRNDFVVALGGGVCGDMAGFAASMYLRGVSYVQVPTSLLAQIDSSVGGKTAVDLPEGKNLCGAFWQPRLVLIDPAVLATLPKRFFCDGMAEAIKTAAIKSSSLFARLEGENARSFIDEMIYECVLIKSGVVERDEKEKGERALLNFGHTVGHAIEKYFAFTRYTHGEAVAIGMVLAARAAQKHGLCEKGTAERLEKLLKEYNLPTESPVPISDLISPMAADKKRYAGVINFVLLSKIGSSFIHPVQLDDIEDLFV